MRKLAAALVAGAALASAAGAQDPGSRPTREYVEQAGESDTFEIREAQTALTASSDPQVRAFAQRMIADHGRTSATLMRATQSAGLKPPPMQVGADQAQMLGALQSQREPEFDKTYWKQQALSHRSALTVTQKYATTGDTPAVRRAAAAAVPLIQAHLAMAEQMSARAGG